MTTRYEAWIELGEDVASITLGTVDDIARLRRQGLLPESASLLHRIEADTPEEASAAHHVKMGWEPYQPMGRAMDCPKGCGAKFYPEGSGYCPNCGPIC